MDKFESLNHTKWDCKYHIVFIPKGRRKVLYAQLRQHLGEVFKPLKDEPYATKKAYVCYHDSKSNEWWFQRQPHASEVLYPSEIV
jgi:hypothetical protein